MAQRLAPRPPPPPKPKCSTPHENQSLPQTPSPRPRVANPPTQICPKKGIYGLNRKIKSLCTPTATKPTSLQSRRKWAWETEYKTKITVPVGNLPQKQPPR